MPIEIHVSSSEMSQILLGTRSECCNAHRQEDVRARSASGGAAVIEQDASGQILTFLLLQYLDNLGLTGTRLRRFFHFISLVKTKQVGADVY
ncbi:hypothetical protein RRG08_033529 [Elysia crispata]|uniref:Uncharacterized protein n=1 Tax=Elysia crispata TaxID=231223 RepID=A0AAE1CJP9_9GAST|nr:hypothetical protein RRG08_033529 [Elysia crispata]